MLHVIKEILPIIQQSAPLIATFLTGSPLTGILIETLSKAFGSKAGDVSDLVQQIQSNPNTPTILQHLELEHSSWLSTIMNIKHPQSFEMTLKIVWPDPKNNLVESQ